MDAQLAAAQLAAVNTAKSVAAQVKMIVAGLGVGLGEPTVEASSIKENFDANDHSATFATAKITWSVNTAAFNMTSVWIDGVRSLGHPHIDHYGWSPATKQAVVGVRIKAY